MLSLSRRVASRPEARAPRIRRRTALLTLLATLSLGLLAVLGPVASAVTTGTPTQTGPTTTPPRPSTTTPRPTTTTARPTTTTARPTTTTAAAADPRVQVLTITNQERAKVGCPALVRNAALDKAAQLHSVYQAETRTLSHTGRGGTNAGQRITAQGYTWTRWGENVAYGYTTPAAVMNGWMNSPGHRANILNCSFKEIGLGLGQPGYYWTQKFATR